MSDENDQSFLKFKQIPEAVRAFLASEKTTDKRIELVDKYELVDRQPLTVARIMNRIYDGEAAFTDLPKMLEIELKLPPETAKKMALDYAGYEFLPLTSFLGDVDSFIRSLGGNSGDYPSERIVLRELRPMEVVTEFLHDYPVNVPAFLEHRLREILESRVREVRKDAETITRLTRAEKIGGVELPQAEAEALVEALAAKIASVKIAPDNAPMPAPSVPEIASRENEAEVFQASDEPSASSQSEDSTRSTTVPVTAVKAAATIAAAATAASAISKKGDAFMPQDEQEADAIRAKVLPRVISESLFDQEEEIKKGTEEVFSIYGLTLPENLKERFKTIIASRLKGIRDQAETEDLLIRTVAVGGMGFGIDSADRILRAIESQVAIVNGKRVEAMKKEKEVFVKRSIEATYAKDESRKRGETEELDRMYGSLTGKVRRRRGETPQSLAPEVSPQVPPPTPKPAMTSAAAPIVTPTHALKPQPVPSALPVYEPQPAAQLPPRPQPAPTPAPSVLTTNNSQLGTRMQDVRPVASAARLTGPAEELKNMTLVDFRRLSADPAEACRKIVDKLDLLEEHSYAKRIEGVKAWQQSEVNKLYLQVIMAAFSGGKPIADAIAENQAANRETLTEREVHAIMELNKGLKA